MRIDHAIYRPVDMRWDTFTFPIKAGTPVSKAGVEANDGTAMGIIPQNVAKPAPTGFLLVLTGGTVDLDEVTASYGEISEAAQRAMTGITFYSVPPDVDAFKASASDRAALDELIAEGGGGLPAVTSDDNGDVLTVVDGEWSKAAPGSGGGGAIYLTEDENHALPMTYGEIEAAIENGSAVYLKLVFDWGGGEIETRFMPCYNLYELPSGFAVGFIYQQGLYNYLAATEDDYPVYDNTPG